MISCNSLGMGCRTPLIRMTGYLFCVLVGLIRLSQGQIEEAWAALNTSVSGRLHPNRPFALPCYSLYNGNAVAVDEATCSIIRDNYTTNSIRAETPGGYLNLQGEICLGNPSDECTLNNTEIPALEPSSEASCNQGSVPSYYIEVDGASDIIAGLDFSREYQVPLVIKNSGHDYMTRNSQKGSLSLWVHKLQNLTFHEDFVPEGCTEDLSVGRAITGGTGVSTGDLYRFAYKYGSTFIGGYSSTIAASGGWVLGGGHSVLSPVYGLGADRVVEFKIVTPDRVLRVANQCQNEDLFWALRGGGGGTFGVVLEATHRVEPTMPIAVANIRLPSNVTAETSMKWIELMARQSLTWGKQGWGGHAAGLYLTYMNPTPAIANLTDESIAAKNSMNAATEFALATGGTSDIEVLPDFFDVWDKYVLSGALATAGIIRVLSTRLIPRKLFENETGIAKIMGFMASAEKLGFDPRNFYCPVGTPFVVDGATTLEVGNRTRPLTAVQPAWYDSLWDISTSLTIPWDASYAERLQNMTALTKATILAEELTGTDGGTYLNEADPFTLNWRESWWGSNYAALLEVKKKYDPEGLLKCWKCVGFEDEELSSDRFSCQGKLQLDVNHNLVDDVM
ncbi:FAD-binding domain-containing protein [Jackrogersella minutella]|nr:FAD-binding domain-containing protein [Jackrogersella minutella]